MAATRTAPSGGGLPSPEDVPEISATAKVMWVVRQVLKQAFLVSIPVLIVLGLWEVVARSGVAHPALMPPLANIFGALLEMIERGILWQDIQRSVWRLGVSVSVGVVIGTSIGLAMGMNRWVERMLVPLLNFGLATPGIALIPLAILWFGLTDMTIISILILEVILVTMLNTWTSVKGVEQRLIDAARTMGTHGIEMFQRVLLPGSLAGIIGGYRLAFSRAWRILVAGEMLAGVAAGLGYRIFEARQLFRADRVYAGILVIGILGLILERVVLRTLESATVERWGVVRELK